MSGSCRQHVHSITTYNFWRRTGKLLSLCIERALGLQSNDCGRPACLKISPKRYFNGYDLGTGVYHIVGGLDLAHHIWITNGNFWLMGPQIIQHVSNWVMVLSLMEKFMVLRYLSTSIIVNMEKRLCLKTGYLSISCFVITFPITNCHFLGGTPCSTHIQTPLKMATPPHVPTKMSSFKIWNVFWPWWGR